MLKVENTEVFGWEAAIRGMRNPMNSWHLSDSEWSICPDDNGDETFDYVVGEKDLKLMQNLSKAGDDHGKFLRYINVTVDITAPLYWWKEFDTYKVGTVANSCSTMHKIHAKEFTVDDFSAEHLDDVYYVDDKNIVYFDGKHSATPFEVLCFIVTALNRYRKSYLETKDKYYWWQMIQLLPSSYNQKRTVQLNYQVLKAMYFARRNHKLDEWHTLCEWMEELPYFNEICIQE